MSETRATLQSSPYPTNNGGWKASALINGSYASIRLTEAHSTLCRGDRVSVVKDINGEWVGK